MFSLKKILNKFGHNADIQQPEISDSQENEESFPEISSGVNLSLIESAEFGPSLTPYISIDNIFSEELISLCKKYWPDEESFSPVLATPGSFELPVAILNNYQELALKEKLSEEQLQFWKEFVDSVVREMITASTSKLMPFLEPRYAKYLDEVMINTCSLRTVNEDFRAVDRHVHHYHDPLWVYTILFYLDDISDFNRGLNLYQFDVGNPANENELIEKVSKFVGPEHSGDRQEHLVLEDTVEYGANKLLVVSDNPFSWHGVGPFDAGAKGWGRRHIVTHVMLPREYITDLYGIPHEEFTHTYMTDHSDKIMDDFRKDVAASLNLEHWKNSKSS